MNKLLKALASASIVSLAPAAQAAVTNNNFTVSVTLNSKCEQTNTGVAALAFGSYDAFRTTDLTASASATLQFRCTRGFSPTSIEFDTTNGTTSAPGATATGNGVLAGLRYQVSAAAAVVAGGTAATPASIGTADAVSYAVSGLVYANQAGTDTAGVASHVRTLIVTF